MKISYEWLKEYVNIDIPPRDLSDRLTMAGLEVAGIEEVAGDYILDIELTVNRGDCLSVKGMAREIAAILNINGKYPAVSQLKEDIRCEVEIFLQNPELCPRYTARVIQNVRVEPSPLWLQEKLKRFGIRPINNIVDVTNFCLAELGHPMHAFDYDLINGNSVIIRHSKEGEKIEALDEHEYELSDEMLVIADQMKPIALAGIIGGAATGVTEGTTTILMECACFSTTSIRKTDRLLGIQTESSYRFERGVDPQGLINAQNRAAELILSMCPEARISNIIDCYPTIIPRINISLRIERVNRILGTEIIPEEMRDILIRLGFEVEPIIFHPYALKVKVPSFRLDITREIDIVEEIFRIYGCEKIPVFLPSLNSVAFKKKAQIVDEMTKNILCGCGLNEVITYSFLNPEMLDKMRTERQSAVGNRQSTEGNKQEGDETNSLVGQVFLPVNMNVVVSNPLSEDGKLLTHSLIPNLLEVAAWNVHREVNEVKIFEIARVFSTRGSTSGGGSTSVIDDKDSLLVEKHLVQGEYKIRPYLPVEQEHLGIMIRDEGDRVRWDGEKQKGAGFYNLSGILHALFAELGIHEYILEEANDDLFHPCVCASIRIGDEKLGLIGQINPNITKKLKLPQNIYAMEVEWQKVRTFVNLIRKFTPLPRYPSVKRDIAILAKDDMPSSKIVGVIQDAGRELIENIELFDMYQGEHVPTGYKSLAYSITYRLPDKTLTEDEVNKVHDTIIRLLGEKLGVGMR